MIRILSGKYKTCLVLAHAKMSEGSQNVIANAMFDPIYQRALGLDEIIAGALQARAYMDRWKIPPETTAEAAAKSLSAAAKNKWFSAARKPRPSRCLPPRCWPARSTSLKPLCRAMALAR